jgi:hypothetical protein
VQWFKRRLRRDLFRIGLLTSATGHLEEGVAIAAFLEREVDCKWSGRALSLFVGRHSISKGLRFIAGLAVVLNRKLRGLSRINKLMAPR